MPQVDPKFTFWFGVWTNVLMLVAGYGVEHAPPLVAQYAPTVQWFASLSAQTNSVILTALVGISSTKPGPLINVPAITVVKALLVALALALLAVPQGAMAQGVQRKLPAINLPIDPLHLNGTAVTGDPNVDLKAIWDKIVKASDADLSYASALAATAGTPAAKQRKQCWDAITALNQQANGTNLKNADGTVMVRPDAHLFSDIESQAEIIDNLSPQGQLFTSCAGAAEMAKMNVLQFVSAVVTGAAGFAAIP